MATRDYSSAVARIRAEAALLRRRRGGNSAAEVAAFWRAWAERQWPEYAESIEAMPDSYFRRSDYRNPEGWGQDPDEVRRRFLELITKEDEDNE